MKFEGVLTADRVVTGWADWHPGWIGILDGQIVDTGAGAPPPGRGQVTHLNGTILPGFVDIHAHGAVGSDFGRASIDGCREAVAFHASRGTTTMLASIASASIEEMLSALSVLHRLCTDRTIGGVHIEGPYLSPRRRGAHNTELLRKPNVVEMKRLLNAGHDVIKVVTVAPELDGAEAVVRLLNERGVRVAIGHTDCDSSIARASFDWGVSIATHLFNGMPELEHRSPGPVGASLVDERVVIELILDGHHVSPDVVEIARRSAPDRYILVSDAMEATGQADGLYEIAGSMVKVSDGIAMLADESSLAGSTKTILDCLPLLLDLPGMCLLEVAEATAIRPALAIGIDRPGLQAQATADLLLFDFSESVSRPTLMRVMRQGRWLE